MKAKRLLLTVVLSLLAASSSAASAELDEVKALAAKGRTEKALSQLERFLIDQPAHFEGQFLRGVLLVEAQRTGDAERAFLVLAQQQPQRPEPINNLAVLRAASGKRATAITALEEIVAYYPSYEAAATNLERIRTQLGGASGYDPMDPDASQVPLVLTAELGSYPRVEPVPEPALPAEEIAATAESQAASALVAEAAPELAAAPGEVAEAVVSKPERALAPGPPPAEAVPSPAAVATAAEPSPGADSTAAAAELPAGVREAVAAWASAWSEQRIKEYLAFYAADFEPTGYASRQAWETVRRQRLAAPAFIEVKVDLETSTVRETGPGEASVTFTQSYRSDSFSDTVEKTLDMVREVGAWRIRRETSR